MLKSREDLMIWWERFGLLEGPFDKIKAIPTNKLDKLLVKTSIFQEYELLAEKQRTFFGRAILIYGPFGSGKTTLFNFIKKCFFGQNIICQILRLSGPFETSKELEEKFLSQLYEAIEHRKGKDIGYYDIIQSLKIKKDRDKINGWIFFLDELHKNPNPEITLEFLKNSQGFFEDIFDEIANVGFFVAGDDKWNERMKKAPQYSGTFEIKKEINKINSKEAYEIIKRRFIDCAEERENIEKNFTKMVEKSAIDKLFLSLKEKTPRQLLIKTQQVFENLPPNKTNLSLTDVGLEIENKKLETITRYLKNIRIGKSEKLSKDQTKRSKAILNKKVKLTKNFELVYEPDTINSLFQKVLNKYSNKEEKKAVLKAISRIYYLRYIKLAKSKLNNTILSDLGIEDPLIINTLIEFNVLHKKHVKIEIPDKEFGFKGVTQYSENRLTLNPKISNAFDKIKGDHNLSPEDYLLKIFIPFDKPPKRKIPGKEEEILKNETVQNFNDIKEKLKKFGLNRASNLFNRCISNYVEVLRYLRNPHVHLKSMDVISRLDGMIDDIFQAYRIYKIMDDEYNSDPADIHNHFDNEELIEFKNHVQFIKSTGKMPDRDDAETLCDLFNSFIREVILIFMQDIKYDTELQIDSPDLTKKDKKTLREIRTYFFDLRKERLAFDEAIFHFENKIRSFIVLFLNNEYEEWIDQLDRIKIKEQTLKNKIISKIRQENKKLEDIKNPLCFSDFHDLLLIMTNKNLWNKNFWKVFKKNKKKKLISKWEVIEELRNPWAHNRGKDPSFLNNVKESFMNMIWILEKINKEIPDIDQRSDLYHCEEITGVQRKILEKTIPVKEKNIKKPKKVDIIQKKKKIEKKSKLKTKKIEGSSKPDIQEEELKEPIISKEKSIIIHNEVYERLKNRKIARNNFDRIIQYLRTSGSLDFQTLKTALDLLPSHLEAIIDFLVDLNWIKTYETTEEAEFIILQNPKWLRRVEAKKKKLTRGEYSRMTSFIRSLKPRKPILLIRVLENSKFTDTKLRKMIEKINVASPSTIKLIWDKVKVNKIEVIKDKFGFYAI